VQRRVFDESALLHLDVAAHRRPTQITIATPGAKNGRNRPNERAAASGDVRTEASVCRYVTAHALL
jgi:hypothetical protein